MKTNNLHPSQHKDQNCEFQLRDLRAFCAARHFNIVREFVDVGESGVPRPNPRTITDQCRRAGELEGIFHLETVRVLGNDWVVRQDDLSSFAPRQLLALHSRICDELRSRGITRSSSNPVGDLAEYMFCKAFGWKQAGNSSPKIDAVGTDGIRYQIKDRR
jgi:hypothetical protein